MDKRREVRKLAAGDVRIAVGGVWCPCAIRNLSSSGCMVEATRLSVAVGATIELVLAPDCVVSGEIAWQLGESIGIFFPEPIPEHLVRHYALDDWMLRGDWSAHSVRIPVTEP